MKVFKIKIIYKSGATHEFEVTDFSYEETSGGKRVKWDPYSIENQPLSIGLEEIAAVWQVGVREVEDNS